MRYLLIFSVLFPCTCLAFTNFRECGQYEVTGSLLCPPQSQTCKLTVYPASQSQETLTLDRPGDFWTLRSGVTVHGRIHKTVQSTLAVSALDRAPSLALPDQTGNAVKLLKREKCEHD